MKTLNYFAFILWLGSAVNAQSQTQPVWTSSFPNKADFLRYASPNGDWLLGTTRGDAVVLDGKTGTPIWTADFESLAGSKKVDIQYVMEDAGVFFIYNEKAGRDVLTCLDLVNGQKLWETDRFENLRLSSIIYMAEIKAFAIVVKEGFILMDARSGEIRWTVDRFRGSIADSYYDAGKNELIVLNYKTSWGALFSGYKNQLMSIDVSNGNINWEAEYFGVIHNAPFSGRLIYDWKVTNDKILLMVQGLQVIERKSGRQIWKTEFDLFDSKLSTYVYGGIAYPLVAENAVYLIYNKPMSGKVLLQKLNMENGNPIWETKLEGKNPVIPSIALENENLILQIGGRVTIEGTDNNGVNFRKTRWDGPFGVMVVNAQNGEVRWMNDDFKNRSTEVIIKGDELFCADEKSIHRFNVTSGQESASISLKTLKTGAPYELELYSDKLLFLGEDGLSILNSSSGELIHTIPAKETYEASNRKGGHYLLNSDKSIQYVNLNTGAIDLMVKHEKDMKFITSREGKTVFHITRKEAARYDFDVKNL